MTLPYTVKKRNFASTDIVLTFDKNEFYYNGASQHPVVKVTDAGRDNVELTEGVDYELYYVAEYSDNPESIETVNAGTYYVQARGIGAYYVNQKTQARVEQSYKYEIKAKPITLTAVDFAAAYGADLQIPEPLYSITGDIEGLTVTEADKDAIKNTLTYQYYYLRWRTLNANTQLNEGTYNYRVRAAENSNYAFTYVNGQLSITDTEFIVKVNSGFVAVSVALVAPGMAGGVSVQVGSGAIVTSNVAPVGHGSIVFLPPTVVSPVATYFDGASSFVM